MTSLTAATLFPQDFSDAFEDNSFSEQYNGYSNQTEDHDAGRGGNVTKNNEGRAMSSNLIPRQPIVEQSIGQHCGSLGLISFAQGMVIGSLFSTMASAVYIGKATEISSASLHPLKVYLCDSLQV